MKNLFLLKQVHLLKFCLQIKISNVIEFFPQNRQFDNCIWVFWCAKMEMLFSVTSIRQCLSERISEFFVWPRISTACTENSISRRSLCQFGVQLTSNFGVPGFRAFLCSAGKGFLVLRSFSGLNDSDKKCCWSSEAKHFAKNHQLYYLYRWVRFSGKNSTSKTVENNFFYTVRLNIDYNYWNLKSPTKRWLLLLKLRKSDQRVTISTEI